MIIDNQPLRGALGDVLPEILSNESKREVDARRDPGGGPNRPIAREDSVWLKEDLRIGAGKFGRTFPMSRRAAIVEQSGFCKKKRAGTYAGRPSGTVSGIADKLQRL